MINILARFDQVSRHITGLLSVAFLDSPPAQVSREISRFPSHMASELTKVLKAGLKEPGAGGQSLKKKDKELLSLVEIAAQAPQIHFMIGRNALSGEIGCDMVLRKIAYFY